MKTNNSRTQQCSALNLLLGTNVRVVAALSLSAVGCLGWELDVALTADHLIDFVLLGESCKCWLDLELTHSTTSESEDQVESRFLLDVVIRESSSIFQLLSCEDQSLLVGWDALFVLDLSPKRLQLT